jgi:hypothetical protein
MTMQDDLQKKFEELKSLLHHGPSLEPLWQGLIKAIGELETGGTGEAGLANKIANWDTRIKAVEDEAKKYFAVLSAVVQQTRTDVDDLKTNQNAAAEHLDRLSRFVGSVVTRLDAAGVAQLPPPPPPVLADPPPISAVEFDPPKSAAESAPEPAAPEQTPVLADPPTAQPDPAPAGSAQTLLEGSAP